MFAVPASALPSPEIRYSGRYRVRCLQGIPEMKLTAEAIIEAAPRNNADGKPRPSKFADGHGLYLYVAPGGGKLWRLDYESASRLGRIGRNGKAVETGRNTLSLGPAHTATLEDARRSLEQARADAKAARERIALGRDPAQEREVAKLTAAREARNTFAHVAADVIRHMRREGRARKTIRKRIWLYRVLANDLRRRPIADITAAEVKAVLKRVESRGHRESALRLRSAIGQVMRYAIADDKRPPGSDPTPALRGLIAAPDVKHRAAVTTPEQAGRLMVAIEGYPAPVVRSALLLSAYTFVRPADIRMAVWPEVSMRDRMWTIPKARTKTRQADHRVPLSDQAMKQFQLLWRATGRNGDGLCFPGLRAGRPISENTINMALRTLGFGGDEHTAHGFRAMASTLLNERSDFDGEVIERALAHKEPNAVKRAYNRAAHMEERTRLMQWYADYLDEQANAIKREHQGRRIFG